MGRVVDVNKSVMVGWSPEKPGSPKKKSDESYASSHRAMIPVLLIAQLFATMPIYGFNSHAVRTLRFVWLSGRVFHHALVVASIIIMSVLSIVWGGGGEISIRRLEPTIWFGSKCCIMLYFTKLARKWPCLMEYWESVELQLPEYRDAKRNWNFHRHIKLYTITITVTLFVEHSMSIAASVYRASLCANASTINAYFNQAYPQVYHLVPFSGGGIVEFLVEFINYYCTFLWSFMDMFVMAISICLTTRMHQFNEHLIQYKGVAMSQSFWAKQRRLYTNLTALILKVDANIAVITTFSVSNNLYYILMQLLHTFHPLDTFIENFYFWFSLAFLLGRTLFVTMSAAKLNDESKRPLAVLRAIPTEHYHSEAKRFLEQVSNNEIALTGMRFFSLNRRLILSMAGTVVTYELVLIQFQVQIIESQRSHLC